MLAQRLRFARKARGLTQEELAAKVQTTKGTISNYENNYSSPPNEMLSMLADVLDVSTDWLLGRVDDGGISSEKTLDELLQAKIDDPDDYFFLDGYLEASEEEKKEIRRYWYELKRQMNEYKIKESRPLSLFEITEGMKKDSPHNK
ncbi:helix-turn-helix domain-containing protein [Brevibacillus sp. H7]|uniref:helix-turn-helix domain-containing protein n=1 Tax=Brevibacillus sp. H7 TaxID=3349138 RepID=UPI0037F7A13A